ncbi:hypothetical protein LXL04_027945 [Taraxacum kok-saghyz]
MSGKRPAASRRGEFTAGVDHGVANCRAKAASGKNHRLRDTAALFDFFRIFSVKWTDIWVHKWSMCFPKNQLQSWKKKKSMDHPGGFQKVHKWSFRRYPVISRLCTVPGHLPKLTVNLHPYASSITDNTNNSSLVQQRMASKSLERRSIYSPRLLSSSRPWDQALDLIPLQKETELSFHMWTNQMQDTLNCKKKGDVAFPLMKKMTCSMLILPVNLLKPVKPAKRVNPVQFLHILCREFPVNRGSFRFHLSPISSSSSTVAGIVGAEREFPVNRRNQQIFRSISACTLFSNFVSRISGVGQA